MRSTSCVLLRVGRFARWTGVAMLACLWTLGFADRTQAQRPLNVLMTDFMDLQNKQADSFAMQARDAVARELADGGKEKFRVIARSEVLAVAKTLGMRLPQDPLKPADLPHADWLRLARELKADALVTGEINILHDRKIGSVVVVSILVRDVGDDEPINGALERLVLTPRAGESDLEALPRSLLEAASLGVREMIQRAPITATVLNVRQSVVTLNQGIRSGLRAGDELHVYRYGAKGAMTLVGKVRVSKVRETECEAKVLTSNGISPEDVASKIYRPAASAHYTNGEL